MKDESSTTNIWLDELRQQQSKLLEQTRCTDQTATEIKKAVEDLPGLLKPENEDSNATLGQRLIEGLTKLEATLERSNLMAENISASLDKWSEVMAKQEAVFAQQQEKIDALLKALRPRG